MAGEATHVLLADTIFEAQQLPYIRSEFVAGTVFPDIRYLGVLERQATHTHHITLPDVMAEPDPFIAGSKFHSLVDKTRNEFMNSSGVYDQCAPFLYDQQSLKLLEDELFYPLFNEWPRIVGYLRAISAGPKRYGVSSATAKQWYDLMATYVAQPPSDISRMQLGEALGFTREAIILMNAYIDELKKNKAVTGVMMDFYQQFPRLI